MNSVAVPLSAREVKRMVLSQRRSSPQVARKFYHFLMGVVCAGLYAFVLTKGQALTLIAIIGGAFVVGDILRLRSRNVNQVALKLFGPIMRREELKSITGNSFYVLGLFVVTALFPKPIVVLAVLYLGIGDPVAALVGTSWGKHRLIGKKSIEGALANFVATATATFLVGNTYFHLDLEKALGFSVIGGMVSVVAELIPAPFDDNFTIPVVSAALLTLVNLIFPFF